MDATIADASTLVDVVRLGSITAAAAERDVPKSTISRSISRLEAALGTKLLHRQGRILSLTTAGRNYHENIAPHIQGLRDAKTLLDESGESPHGLLRISAPPDTADLLAEIVEQFYRRYPDITVHLDLSTRVVNLSAEGFDLALRAAKRVLDPDLVARQLGSVELGLYASSSYVKEHGAPTQAEHLSRHASVLFQPHPRRHQLRLVRKDGVVEEVVVHGNVTSNEFAMVRAAIRVGFGIGPLPHFFAEPEVRSGHLVRVLPQHRLLGGNFFVVYPQASRVPKRVILFRDFLVDAFRSIELRGA